MRKTLSRLYLRHEKAVLVLAVSAFFLLGYLGVARHTAGGDARSLATPLDAVIPYVPGAWPLYQSVYLLVFLPVRLYSRPEEMRRGAAANAACMAAAYALFLLYPVRDGAPLAGAAPLAGSVLAGGNFAMLFDDRGMNCFPSLHVALATIAAICCARADRRLGILAWTLTALVALASLLLKRHYVLDLPAGLALGAGMYGLFLRGHLRPLPALRPWAPARPDPAP